MFRNMHLILIYSVILQHTSNVKRLETQIKATLKKLINRCFFQTLEKHHGFSLNIVTLTIGVDDH